MADRIARKQSALQGPGQTERDRQQNIDARFWDATGTNYDRQGVGDWMWDTGKDLVGGAQDFLSQPVHPEDVWDLMKAAPSALTRIGTNTLGTPRDTNDMMWSLAHAINRGQRGFTGYDAGLDLMRAEKWNRDSPLAAFSPTHAMANLPSSEGFETLAKQHLPGALTYEPKTGLGQALHVGADFINPEDIAPPVAIAQGAKNLFRRFR